jgi:hypothetical protein
MSLPTFPELFHAGMCFRRLERLALSNLLVKEIDLISFLTRHAPTLEILHLENGNLDPAADIGVQPCWVRVIRRLESDSNLKNVLLSISG